MMLSKKLFCAFALLALASKVSFGDEAAEAKSGDEHVIALTTDAFDKFIADHPLALVEFYAPWCGHCKKLAPEYEKAAKELKEKNIPLAKVDATKEDKLAKKYEVSGYPTLKLFRNGKPEEYKGGRTADGIVQWVNSMSGAAVEIVDNKEAAEKLVAENAVLFVGAFSSKDNDQYATFTAAAEESRSMGKFVAYYNDKAKNDIAVYTKEEGLIISMPVSKKEEIVKFCKEERFPYFGPISGDNYSDYVDSGKDLVWFAGTPDDFKSAKKVVATAAKEYRAKYRFVWLDTEKFKDHASDTLGVKEFPAMVVQMDKARYVYPEDTFTKAAKLTAFMKEVEAGNVPRHFNSEEIPETNDEFVKVVVGKSFKDMVTQKDKDVMLEVYAPWCGHCKKFEPIYTEFAEKMSSNSKLVVAKMDGTANEAPIPNFEWKGFPTVFYVKAGSETPMLFDGDRSMEGLMKFIEKNGPKVEGEEAKTEL